MMVKKGKHLKCRGPNMLAKNDIIWSISRDPADL